MNILDRRFRYTKAANQTVDHLRAVFSKERKRIDALKEKDRVDAEHAAKLQAELDAKVARRRVGKA